MRKNLLKLRGKFNNEVPPQLFSDEDVSNASSESNNDEI